MAHTSNPEHGAVRDVSRTGPPPEDLPALTAGRKPVPDPWAGMRRLFHFEGNLIGSRYIVRLEIVNPTDESERADGA